MSARLWLHIIVFGMLSACGVSAGNPDKTRGKLQMPIAEQSWIDQRYPPGGKSGDLVRLRGENFGAAGRAWIGDQEVKVKSWKKDEVSFRVPETDQTSCTSIRLEGYSDDATYESSDDVTGSVSIVSNRVSFVHGGMGAWLPADDVPMPRQDPVMVWTGKEVIVWGGIPLNTGSRYNPETDSWIRMSQEGAPHSSVGIWTGTELIVPSWEWWAAYDPVKDIWRKIAQPPTGSRIHDGLPLVWTGEEVLIWPGYAYRPTNDTWRTLSHQSGLLTPGSWVAAWTGRHMLIWAGHYWGGGAIYDPQSDEWAKISLENAPVQAIPGQSELGPGVWTGTELIVRGGAYNPATDQWRILDNKLLPESSRYSYWTGSSMVFSTFNELFSYNPSTNTLDTLSLPTDAGRLALALVKENVFLLSERKSYMASLEKFKWKPVGQIAHEAPRHQDASVVWTGMELLSWGGALGGQNGRPDGERYNPATNTWTPMAPAPSGRWRHQAVWTGARMLVWGGDVGTKNEGYWWCVHTDGNCANVTKPSATGFEYNPSANSWVPIASSPVAPTTAFANTIVHAGAEVFISGGTNALVPQSPSEVTATLYNPTTRTWRAVAPHPMLNFLEPASGWVSNRIVLWRPDRYHVPQLDQWVFTSMGASLHADSGMWSDVTTSGAPILSNAVGVVAGNRFAVWGQSHEYINAKNTTLTLTSGGFYDPLTDTWAPISAEGGFRQNGLITPLAVWDGQHLLSIGQASDAFQMAIPDQNYLVTLQYDANPGKWKYAGGSCYTVPSGGQTSVIWSGDEILYFIPGVGMHFYRP